MCELFLGFCGYKAEEVVHEHFQPKLKALFRISIGRETLEVIMHCLCFSNLRPGNDPRGAWTCTWPTSLVVVSDAAPKYAGGFRQPIYRLAEATNLGGMYSAWGNT